MRCASCAGTRSRRRSASETRRAVQAVAGVEGHGLKPWREVIIPHKDVRNGNLRGAEFAADLYYVSLATGRREYVDPVEFFRRTYLTEGLRDLLTWAARRISGDRNAPPVVNLQTNFGGGKTHSMLALWHLLSGTSADVVSGRAAEAAGRLLAARRAPGGAGREPHCGRERLDQAGWHEGADAVGRAGLAARSRRGRPRRSTAGL